jgi:hypothetical protein
MTSFFAKLKPKGYVLAASLVSVGGFLNGYFNSLSLSLPSAPVRG